MPKPSRAVMRIASSPVVVFLVAFTMRIWVLTQLLPQKVWEFFYRYNEPSHIAWALASGFGYSAPWPNTPVLPTAQQPPGYPFLLAIIFKLAGIYSYRSLWIATGLNAALSAATAVLILKIGKRMFGPFAGVLAAWVWSCWLFESASAVRLWESSLAAFLLAVAIMFLLSIADTARTWCWALFGILTGVASLTNTTLLAVLPFFWVWLWLKRRQQGRSCGRLLLTSIGLCLLTLLPWTIRNYVEFHRLMPVRDNFGLELWVGIELGDGKPGAVMLRMFPRDFPLSDPSEYNRLGEISFMDSRQQLAWKFIRDNPRAYASFVASRLVRFWTEPAGTAWPFLSVTAWLGLLLAIKRIGLDALPFGIVLVMFPLVYYVTHTFPTYRHPIEPEILLLAAYAFVTSFELLSNVVRRAAQTAHPRS